MHSAKVRSSVVARADQSRLGQARSGQKGNGKAKAAVSPELKVRAGYVTK